MSWGGGRVYMIRSITLPLAMRRRGSDEIGDPQAEELL